MWREYLRRMLGGICRSPLMLLEGCARWEMGYRKHYGRAAGWAGPRLYSFRFHMKKRAEAIGGSGGWTGRQIPCDFIWGFSNQEYFQPCTDGFPPSMCPTGTRRSSMMHSSKEQARKSWSRNISRFCAQSGDKRCRPCERSPTGHILHVSPEP